MKQSASVLSAVMSGKYKVPSMKEIFELPWNGYNVVSTFSGGGGSCLGYEMAGYHVVWANEFIPEAQNTYRQNHKKTYLNTKDIRKVTAEDVFRETGLKKGEIDLFDGSPPCCAFSTAGSREDGWGKVRKYSDNAEQRVDDLFFEYTRLIRDLQPKVFVAENVSGLVKGKAKGYFKLILAEMKSCGYEVSARLLNAKWLGVPQSRERLIFVGVRKDLVEKYDVHPVHPLPMTEMITLGEALEGIKNGFKVNNCSLVLSILTLQFTPIEYRHKIVKSIYDNLNEGGALIVVEKVLGNTYEIDEMMVNQYYNIKKEHCYTEKQIKDKRKSLEGVLVPITAKWNEELLKEAGFKQIDCFWRCLNFAGWVAIK